MKQVTQTLKRSQRGHLHSCHLRSRLQYLQTLCHHPTNHFKRNSVTRFQIILLAEQIRPWFQMNRQKRFRELFSFLIRYLIPKFENRGQAIFSFYTEVCIFLNYCYWVVNTYSFFRLIVPLKSVISLQSFPKVSLQSCPCLCSQQLHRHRVHIVNDYAETVLSQSTTMPTSCRLSQRFSRISQQKQKILQNSFCLFMLGPGGVFCCLKKCRKSRDTVPFRAVNIPYRKYAGPTKIVRNFV